MTMSCSEPAVNVEPGVSLELARVRAASIAGLHYRLRFDIPDQPDAPIAARAEISFDLAAAAAPLQLDFREDGASIRALRSNGVAADYQFVNEHIVVPGSSLRQGRNTLEIDFVAGSSSLNRNPDFLYTLFVPDRARTAFPLFDQPDLKARYELTLLLPSNWQALSSAPVARVSPMGAQTEYRFAPSDLFSSYLFSFVAGEFESITREWNGRSMTMLHRETDSEKLARNLDAVFDLHAASIAWMEEYTGIAYPFQKFAFALIPGFQYAGMEHVGAIQYRAGHLLLNEAPSDSELLNRAQLIAHETAHMWFGNLVTMRWFDDVWTKEVFANFLADKMVNPGFADINHDLNFLVSHYPSAYAVDRSAGANAIRQALANLNEAGQMYGAIIYDKAPIMMRQLELVVGQEQFREGMREYLQTFAFANATWPDLIAILDARTEVDLATWSRVWVNTPGRPAFRVVTPQAGAEHSGVGQLQQYDPSGLDRVWPQQFSLLAVTEAEQATAPFMPSRVAAALPVLCSAADSVSYLYNADGYGYGLFPFDLSLFEAWQNLEEVARGVALINAYENLLAGSLTDVQGYFGRLLESVQTESNQLLVELALDQLYYVYYSLLTDAQRAQQTAPLESVLWNTMLAQQDSSRVMLLFKAFGAMASSPDGVRKLRGLWLQELSVDGLILEEEDMITLAETLAIRLPVESEDIIRRQLAAIQNPDRRRRLEFLAPSLSPWPAVRDAFFDSLQSARNRQTEPWVIDALSRLHHPSRLRDSQKYVLPSLELLQEIQVTGDIFFPTGWLMATLRNYHSPEAAAIVRSFLDQRPHYNAQLRMKILQAADPLFRAIRIRPVGA